jgi:hypothetical protein
MVKDWKHANTSYVSSCYNHYVYVDQIRENILNFIRGIGLQVNILMLHAIMSIIGLAEIRSKTGNMRILVMSALVTSAG